MIWCVKLREKSMRENTVERVVFPILEMCHFEWDGGSVIYAKLALVICGN